jgi:hypothetical protein
MSCLDRFLGLGRDFWYWKVVSRHNQDSRSSRLTFFWCQDFLDRRDWLFFGVEIESLDRDTIKLRQIETPRANISFWDFSMCQVFFVIFRLKNSWSSEDFSTNLDKSWQILTNLNNLNLSWQSQQSWQKSRRDLVSTEKVLILKILTENIQKFVETVETPRLTSRL